MPTLVIGLIGQNVSDKETISRIKKELGGEQSIHYVLLSDIFRQYAPIRGKKDPQSLRELAQKIRVEYGAGAWIQRLLSNLPKEKREGILIIDAISNPGEIDLLRELFGERALVMATDFIELKQQKGIQTEDRSWYGSDLRACLEKADFTIESNKPKEERLAEVSEAVSRFSRLAELREKEEPQEEVRRERKVA